MAVDEGTSTGADAQAQVQEQLALAEPMLKALPKDTKSDFGQEQRMILERNRDACKTKKRAAQPFQWRAHDVVNQTKQLEIKRGRQEAAIDAAQRWIEKTQQTVDDANA